MAPSSRVEVAFEQPDLRWRGSGYFDTNDGDEPLEAAFSRWTWCRAELPDGAAILYDVHHRQGGGRAETVHGLQQGVVEFPRDSFTLFKFPAQK